MVVMLSPCIKLLLAALCLQITLCECHTPVNNTANTTETLNASSNVKQIVNPVKSLTLHFCPSARKRNGIDPNSTVPLNKRGVISHHIPIQHLIPLHHELKSISVNFDAKCLPKPIPFGKRIKISKAPEQLNVSDVTSEIPDNISSISAIRHEEVQLQQAGSMCNRPVKCCCINVRPIKRNKKIYFRSSGAVGKKIVCRGNRKYVRCGKGAGSRSVGKRIVIRGGGGGGGGKRVRVVRVGGGGTVVKRGVKTGGKKIVRGVVVRRVGGKRVRLVRVSGGEKTVKRGVKTGGKKIVRRVVIRRAGGGKRVRVVKGEGHRRKVKRGKKIVRRVVIRGAGGKRVRVVKGEGHRRKVKRGKKIVRRVVIRGAGGKRVRVVKGEGHRRKVKRGKKIVRRVVIRGAGGKRVRYDKNGKRIVVRIKRTRRTVTDRPDGLRKMKRRLRRIRRRMIIRIKTIHVHDKDGTVVTKTIRRKRTPSEDFIPFKKTKHSVHKNISDGIKHIDICKCLK
ncbi:unnamed protein product [Trichobilharzia szidati]|nr:unnamed protein product [Trichobilharzia szidati]